MAFWTRNLKHGAPGPCGEAVLGDEQQLVVVQVQHLSGKNATSASSIPQGSRDPKDRVCRVTASGIVVYGFGYKLSIWVIVPLGIDLKHVVLESRLASFEDFKAEVSSPCQRRVSALYTIFVVKSCSTCADRTPLFLAFRVAGNLFLLARAPASTVPGRLPGLIQPEL